MTPDPNSPTRHALSAAPVRPADRPTAAPADRPTAAFGDLPTPGPAGADQATHAEAVVPLEPAPPSPLPPIPGYEVEEFVGRGGMGVVYRARHPATGRVVALKLISPRGAHDDVSRGRFVQEVHALARFSHPNIVPVYDAGEWHGFPYCTMAYVPGGTLSEHLDRVRADRRAAVALVAKVARAVDCLHAHGIVHRDLKPLNILLGPGDEPLVADFGLAKSLGQATDLTFTAVPVGTRPYMAPEQTFGRREAYTPACDVWALGVTLYEVLTGRRPFPEDDPAADVFELIRGREPAPLANLAADAPAALQAVVSRCLAKRPEHRYASAAALADDLERWLRGAPVAAAPAVPLPPPPRRVSRRARAAVAAGVLALVAVAAAGALAPRKAADILAAGKPVKLTDDKGFPLRKPRHEPEHGLHLDTLDGYRTFSQADFGLAALSDEPLTERYLVEADVAVLFHAPNIAPAGGFYVGRRGWPGPQERQEMALLATVTPSHEFDARDAEARATRLLRGGLHFWTWTRDGNGSLQWNYAPPTRWDGDRRADRLRFTRVRVEVRGDDVSATVDGAAPKSLTAVDFHQELWMDNLTRQRRNGHPLGQYEAPYVGPGIGIYCRFGTCVVRNLTVSPLQP